MIPKIQAFAVVSILVLSGTAHAQECSRPPEPDIPDGASAELKQMVETKSAVETHIKETEAYLSCVEKQEKAALEEAAKNEEKLSPEERKTYVKRYNAAVESMKRIAADFNTALKTYCKQNPDNC